MNLKCKICAGEEQSGEKFFIHFNLHHRVSSLSRFSCGIDGCFMQFKCDKVFFKHLGDFHQNKPTLTESGTGNNEERMLYKCLFPGCEYECRLKVTLRSHRKRKHGALPIGGEVETSQSGEEAISQSYLDQETFEPPASKVIVVEKVHTPLEVSANISLRDVIVDKYKHHYLTLRSKFHIPETTLQFIINSHYTLLKESGNLMKEQLVNKLQESGLTVENAERIVSLVIENDPVMEMHAPDGPLRTPYMRKKAFTTGNFQYVAPQSHKLGLNEFNAKRKYHTVPIRKSLESMFEDDAVYEQYIQSQDCRSKDGILRDIYDGSLIQSHPDFCDGSKVIGLIFYEDDLELADPLGSAKTQYKITLVEYCLANLRPWSRTKEGVIRLALAVLEKDVAYFGLPKILEPLISELKDLEVNGINIRGEKVKVVTIMLLGDNLGTHTFTGFLENFSTSTYFCRYCEETRAQWNARWNALLADDDSEDESEDESDAETDDSDSELDSEICQDPSEHNGYFEQIEAGPQLPLKPVSYISAPLRTPQSYDQCVKRLEGNPSIGSLKGVVANCQLNSLPSFHCIGSSPPCYGHDVNEGVLSYDTALAVKYFVETYPSVTCEFINRRIRSFKLLGCDRDDRPAKVSMKMKKLRGSAAQNANFLRFLPIYIGDRIDKHDPVWQMVLQLIDLCRILSSPSTPKLSLVHIREKVHRYLQFRVHCFRHVKLRPKHHYLEHYIQMLERFGNLKRVETLPFERKHRFFKNTVYSRKNFINITKTMTEEHQMYISSLSVDQLVNNYPFTKDAFPMDSTDLHPDMKDRAISYFGNDVLSTIACAESVCFRGTWYSKGEIVVINSCDGSKLQLCLIENVFVSGKNCYASGKRHVWSFPYSHPLNTFVVSDVCGPLCLLGWCCEGVLLPSLQVYKLNKTSTTVICNLERLLDYVSYPIYKLNGHDILVIKHMAFFP